MTRAKRMLAMLLAAAMFLAGGPYGSALPAALASVAGASESTAPPCDQCCDGAHPRCLPDAPCGLACLELPALPSVGSAPWLVRLAPPVPLPVSNFAGSVPRPDPPPPQN